MKMMSGMLLAAASLAALSSTAMAADLARPAPPAPAPVVASTSWDGPYIGANIGGNWGTADVTSTSPTFAGYASTADLSGLSIGGQLGYLFHLSDSVIGGVEANIDWANASGATATPASTYAGVTQTINWNGALVAKLGFDVGGNLLPYIDAGVAFAGSTRDATKATAIPIPGAPNSETQVGWTAGIGLEYKATDTISVFASYNYADYGTTAYATGGNYVPSVHLTDSIAKVGINYHF